MKNPDKTRQYTVWDVKNVTSCNVIFDPSIIQRLHGKCREIKDLKLKKPSGKRRIRVEGRVFVNYLLI